MYKTIVVPIDLGQAEQGQPMIGVAKRLGDKDAKIIVVNVVEDVPARVAAELPAAAHDKISQDARTDLEAMVKASGADAEVDIRYGHPPSAIITVAEEKGADLIIVASHRPDWHDFLIGSTAARVVRHAQCSVLVVR